MCVCVKQTSSLLTKQLLGGFRTSTINMAQPVITWVKLSYAERRSLPRYGIATGWWYTYPEKKKKKHESRLGYVGIIILKNKCIYVFIYVYIYIYSYINKHIYIYIYIC